MNSEIALSTLEHFFVPTSVKVSHSVTVEMHKGLEKKTSVHRDATLTLLTLFEFVSSIKTIVSFYSNQSFLGGWEVQT